MSDELPYIHSEDNLTFIVSEQEQRYTTAIFTANTARKLQEKAAERAILAKLHSFLQDIKVVADSGHDSTIFKLYSYETLLIRRLTQMLIERGFKLDIKDSEDKNEKDIKILTVFWN